MGGFLYFLQYLKGHLCQFSSYLLLTPGRLVLVFLFYVFLLSRPGLPGQFLTSNVCLLSPVIFFYHMLVASDIHSHILLSVACSASYLLLHALDTAWLELLCIYFLFRVFFFDCTCTRCYVGCYDFWDCSGALIFCAVEHMVVYYTRNEISLSIPSSGALDLRVGCAMLYVCICVEARLTYLIRLSIGFRIASAADLSPEQMAMQRVTLTSHHIVVYVTTSNPCCTYCAGLSIN